jgi:hypothetical protein
MANLSVPDSLALAALMGGGWAATAGVGGIGDWKGPGSKTTRLTRGCGSECKVGVKSARHESAHGRFGTWGWKCI